MTYYIEYFDRLKQLLEQEELEDRKQFENYQHRTSLQMRDAEGKAWYPVEIELLDWGNAGDMRIVAHRTPSSEEWRRW